MVGDRVVIAGGCSGSDSGSCTELDSIYISNDLGDVYGAAEVTTESPEIVECSNKYIGVNDRSLTWTEANNYCSNLGTRLATITSYDDMIEALTVADDTGFYKSSLTRFFVGYYYDLNDLEWKWSDGNTGSFPYNFVESGSSRYCSQVYWQDNGEQYLNAVKCSVTGYFLCNNPGMLNNITFDVFAIYHMYVIIQRYKYNTHRL